MKLLIFAVFIVTSFNACCQSIIIKNIDIYNINEKDKNYNLNKNKPTMIMQCIFENVESKDITIRPSMGRTFLLYTYNNTTYAKEILSNNFYNTKGQVNLNKLSDTDINFIVDLSFIESINNIGNNIYINLIQILPTIRVLYKEDDKNLKIYSNEIKNITIK